MRVKDSFQRALRSAICFSHLLHAANPLQQSVLTILTSSSFKRSALRIRSNDTPSAIHFSSLFHEASPLHQSVPAILSMQQTRYISRIQQFIPCSKPLHQSLPATRSMQQTRYISRFQHLLHAANQLHQSVPAIRSMQQTHYISLLWIYTGIFFDIACSIG